MTLFVSAPAAAQLYRWVDPDSGSVKFSSLPPTDPRVNAEVVSPRSQPLPAKPAAASPAAANAGLPPVAPLESRWREMVDRLTGLSTEDMARSGDAFRAQAEMLQALKAELDRIDPAGAARRNQEALGILERLRQALGK